MPEYLAKTASAANRKTFIGGSDARVIVGDDEGALLRLWREKRGEAEPEDLSGNLVVQLGVSTERLNRRWYEARTGEIITDVQAHMRHPTLRWMAATLDGRLKSNRAIFEAKFMLPWSFSEEAAAQKYTPQLQHNMWVFTERKSVLSIITGGGKWVEIKVHADPLYQHLILTAERLALRRERRAAQAVRGRTAEAADRGGTDCRYDVVQHLVGIRRGVFAHPGGAS
jgi:predicted phage-related endonuclease